MTQKISRRALLAGTSLLAASAAGAAIATTRVASRRWGLAIDTKVCASRDGCRACIDACHREHRVPTVAERRHRVEWIGQAPFGSVFPEQVHAYSGAASVARPVLVLCNHCESPPCTRVCPVGATWQRSDGIVAMDPHRCLGCRYCMVACPYGARSFNWSDPSESSPPTSYPTRSAGVVEKCTFCAERIDVGLAPSCVAACQTEGASALVFGDLNDPDSEIRRVLATRPALRRRPQLGTEPQVYYLT